MRVILPPIVGYVWGKSPLGFTLRVSRLSGEVASNVTLITPRRFASLR